MAEPLPGLTSRQWDQLLSHQTELNSASHWCGELPVMVLERCWLRLRCIPVKALIRELPPDASAEAPELVHYRNLLQGGCPAWQAQLICWQEYGTQACQQAQQRFWAQLEAADGGWTLDRYHHFVARYRHELRNPAPRALPLLIEARPDSGESHQLHWLDPLSQSMRHTCA